MNMLCGALSQEVGGKNEKFNLVKVSQGFEKIRRCQLQLKATKMHLVQKQEGLYQAKVPKLKQETTHIKSLAH